uniref:ADP-ribosyltransferase n=1 Tax=Mycobacterium sp. HUMS_1102779 TaxID=3383487 RepID=UPI0038998BA2
MREPNGGKLGEPDDDATDHRDASDGGPPTALDSLSSDDLAAIADYTGTGYLELNDALRSSALDASQQARVDAVNRALAKLPPYHGPVVRGTDLPPEVLAQYQPGEVITEKAFLSTTTNPAVAQSSAFAGNVEFRILSSTGRDVSSISAFPGELEILFPARSRFYVLGRRIDPSTGRTIIEMIERAEQN